MVLPVINTELAEAKDDDENFLCLCIESANLTKTWMPLNLLDWK